MISLNSSYLEMISTQIKSILAYLHKNAWTIVFLIVGGYICYDQCKFYRALGCVVRVVGAHSSCIICRNAKHHSFSLSLSLSLLCHIRYTTRSYIINIVIDPLLHKYRTSKSYKEATNPDRVAVLTSDMKRVRAQQQEVTAQRSLQAANEQKLKLRMERERKRVKTPEEERWEKLAGEGNKLGDTTNDTSRSNDAVVDGGDGLRRRRR